MATLKLSGIAASGANLVAADTLVGVHSGTTDLLFSGTQIAAFMWASPLLTTPILGVATGTSIALNGATIGTNDLATAGTVLFGGRLTLTQATANAGIVASTGYSLTGSNATNMIDLAGTWNTSGTPTAIKLNITNTGSNTSSKLIDLQVGGTSQFSVQVGGTVVINPTTPQLSNAAINITGISFPKIFTPNISLSTVAQTGNSYLFVQPQFLVLSAADGTSSVRFNTLANGSLQFGDTDAASGAVAQIHRVQSNTGAATTGPDWTHIGSGGTTVGGNIIFQTKATTSATTTLTLTPLGSVVVGNAAIATNATDGFFYANSGAGTPTGVPTTFTGRVPLYVDTSNSQLWLFLGGAWKQPKTPAAAATVTWQ